MTVYGKESGNAYQLMYVDSFISQSVLPSFDNVCFRTQNFQNFVKVALTKQPKRRPTSDKLLEVSFVKH